MNEREERKRELMKQRVFTWEEAEAQIAAWKARGEIVVFTNGCFDMLHRGHITYLAQAASLGDHLIVESIQRLGPVDGQNADLALGFKFNKCHGEIPPLQDFPILSYGDTVSSMVHYRFPAPFYQV